MTPLAYGALFSVLFPVGGMAGLASEPAPIAPPVAQLGADCHHSVYATDQLVCADRDLRALDSEVTRKAMLVEQRSLWPDSAWFEDQQAWFRRRSLCAFQNDHRECTAMAYRMRLVELDASLSPPPTPRSLRCRVNVTLRASSVAKDGALFVSDANGKPVLVAFPSITTGWSGFVTYRQSGRQIIFHRADGTRDLRCRWERQGD